MLPPSVRGVPVRVFLLIVAVVLVLPGLLFGGILLGRFAESERADNRADLLAAAARLADAVDRELGVMIMAARVLATSQRMAGGDIAAFASEARAAASVVGEPVFLVTPDGARVMSTAQVSETALGANARAEIMRVVAERRPRVSPLLIDDAERPQVLVLAPVLRGNEVVYVVGLPLDPIFFTGLLRQQSLSSGWVASVRDADGRLIARTQDSERRLGTQLLPMQQQVLNAAGQIVAMDTLDGVSALVVSNVVPSAQWRVAVAVFQDVVEGPVRRSQLWLALTGAAATVLGMLLAWQFATRISGPLSALALAGRDLGAGRDVGPVQSAISEVQEVAAALSGAHEQLRERGASLAGERARLAAIIETVPVGLLIADASGRVVAGNRQLARMLPPLPTEASDAGPGVIENPPSGVTDAAPLGAIDEDGQPVPDAAMPLPRALAGEDPAEIRRRFRRADGSLFWAQAVAAPITGSTGEVTGVVLALLDIDDAVRARLQKERWAEQLEAEVRARTGELENANRQVMDEVSARSRAEDQLRQAQKMEAVGRLTGGIAHDFNNLLTVILGSLELLRRRVPDPGALVLVDSAVDGATRAAELVGRLLAFSRRQPLLPQKLDVNQLVAGMSTLLRRSLGETIAIETVLDHDVWPAMADPNQLESALLNLAVNARDAILDVSPGGGMLRIETEGITIEPDAGLQHGALRPGDYVVITTIDNGSGMSAETVAQVFEPFFTTKPRGKGTGLGLSQVHGFAVQSGGYVTVESELGRGATVKLFLPRAESDFVADIEVGPRSAPPSLQPGAIILLVEDEPAVRVFIAEALRLLGYGALEADGGEAALDLLGGHPEIALMMTDVVMPGMNGRELAREVERRRPDLPILLASGFSRAAEEPDDTHWDLLPKPFTISELAEKINRVLRQHGDRVAHGDAPALDDLRMNA